MANSNGVITPSVTMPTDIAAVLGIAGTNLATLCTASNINMWARFKPIYHAEKGLLKNSQRADATQHVVSGYSISYGIKKPSTWSWTDYINPSNGQVSSGKWGYDRPTGGSSSPYRLGDFVEVNNSGATTGNGYWHQAVCPISFGFSQESQLPVPKQSSYQGTVISFVFTFQNGVSGWNSRYCMYLNEIFSGELEYYPTVIMTCYYNNAVRQYCKSADNKVSYYTGAGVNPYVQVLVNTHDLCSAQIYDGAVSSYNSGCISAGKVWTCCMVLTSQKIAGTDSQHSIPSGVAIRRLEYADGVDRRDLTTVLTTPLDDVVSMSYTITIRKNSGGGYYIDTISVTTKTQGTNTLYFTVDATMVCIVGYLSGNGWNNVQQQTRTGWANLTVEQTGSVHTVTKNLSADMPTFNFTGDASASTRAVSGNLSFRVGSTEFTSSFGWSVYNGASSYSSTITLK